MPKAKEPRPAAEIILGKLRRGATNAEALAAAKAVHPRCAIRLTTVNWYRNRLRDKGLKILSDRETRKKRG